MRPTQAKAAEAPCAPFAPYVRHRLPVPPLSPVSPAKGGLCAPHLRDLCTERGGHHLLTVVILVDHKVFYRVELVWAVTDLQMQAQYGSRGYASAQST